MMVPFWMTSPPRFISETILACASTCVLPPSGTMPSYSMRSRKSASLIASLPAAFSFATTSAGVPLGTNSV